MPPLKEPPKPDEYRMSLGDHLEDLRYRIMMGVAGPFVFAMVLFFFAGPMITFMTRPLIAGLKEHNLPPDLYVRGVMGVFPMYIKVSTIGGVILGIPWLAYHLWMFIAPGLYPKERRFVTRLIPGTVGLSFAGVAFMYYALLPLMVSFLIHFTLEMGDGDTHPKPPAPTPPGIVLPQIPILETDPDKAPEGSMWLRGDDPQVRVMVGGHVLRANLTVPSFIIQQIELDDYIRLVLLLALSFAIAFQLPQVMLGLALAGIVSYEQMASSRRYALLINTILGAVLTGGEVVVSMMVLALTLQGLYEIGLLLVRYKVGKSKPGQSGGDNAATT
jgi:sec-independent protein translocase protein TatC